MRRAAAALLLLAACSRTTPPAAPAGPTGPAAAPSGPSAQAAPLPVAADGRAWVTAAASLRREPSDAAKVAGPAGKQVSNYLLVLQRGEPVTLVEGGADWAKVKTSGDQVGWLKRASLLEQEGATVATVLVAADVFDRPDLLAANPRRKLDPGTLLLVVRQKPPFAEVNAGPGPTAWVLADRLVTAERDVSVAKLIEAARWLARNGKKDDALQLLALARGSFAGAPLVEVLAQELGEATPAVTPAAAPAPPPGQALPPTPP
ncbi:MAG TPA: hypothetical protein VFP50_01505 [Anaeromyxobacteraceae bacterium]|nr:hypothetical protein [Anaeromyxobacteraceae bacterium]